MALTVTAASLVGRYVCVETPDVFMDLAVVCISTLYLINTLYENMKLSVIIYVYLETSHAVGWKREHVLHLN